MGNEMGKAPANSNNRQTSGGGVPKATVRLQPKAVPPSEIATPTGTVPRPAAAPKATIRLQPKAVSPSEVATPTGTVPRPAAAPKATIRLQPKAVAPSEVATPTGTVPRPASPPKATIRLQPKAAASQTMDESAPTVEVPKLSKSANPTVKLQAADQKSTTNKTIRLVPKSGKGQSGMIPSGGGVKPSAPTVKLGASAKPSSPTVKLGAPGQAEKNTSFSKSGGITSSNEAEETLVEEETSVLFTIASVASFVALCGSAALIFMSYSDIWS